MRSRFARLRLGELLLREGIVDSERLNAALARQRKHRATLGTNLLELDAVREDVLLQALGRLASSPVVGASQLAAIPPETLALVPEELCRRLGVVPFGLEGRELCLAGLRPEVHVENETTLATAKLVRTYITLDVRLRMALSRYYGLPASDRVRTLARRLDDLAARRSVEVPIVASSTSIAELLSSAPSEAEPGAPLVAASEVRSKTGAVAVAVPGSGEHEIPATTAGPSPEAALSLLATSLDRDEILETLLAATGAFFERRLVFQCRGQAVQGWRGAGKDLGLSALRELSFTLESAPPFLALVKGSEFWLGPLPPGPVTSALALVLGSLPTGCVLLSLRVGDRIIAFLYLDNAERGVAGAPLQALRDLTTAAEQALARVIAKRRR